MPLSAPAVPQQGGDLAAVSTVNQTVGTIPPAVDPRVQTMVARYPFIDTVQLANIFKNDFHAVTGSYRRNRCSYIALVKEETPSKIR